MQAAFDVLRKNDKKRGFWTTLAEKNPDVAGRAISAAS